MATDYRNVLRYKKLLRRVQPVVPVTPQAKSRRRTNLAKYATLESKIAEVQRARSKSSAHD